MYMIRHKSEGITGSLCFRKNLFTTVKKILPVSIIREYLFPFDAPYNNMMEDACRVKPGLSGHRGNVS
jgi:hypothetical protein